VTTPAGTEADDRAEYFFILTAQLHGGSVATLSNTVMVAPGDSRANVYQVVREFVAREVGYSGFTVLFFLLEPNQLPRSERAVHADQRERERGD
jgi:hypothetical protein